MLKHSVSRLTLKRLIYCVLRDEIQRRVLLPEQENKSISFHRVEIKPTTVQPQRCAKL